MDLQWLVNKVFELGNLLYAAVARIDRNQHDIAENSASIDTLASDVSILHGKVEALEAHRADTDRIAETLLMVKPARRQTVISTIALVISALSLAFGIAVTLYYHH